jgi:phosphatidylserine/phosphatidylglycerophosphate/cardiolipin synthase-like enzyme
MTDLTKLLKEIQVPDRTHVDLYKRRGVGSLQWFLEKDVKSHPIHNSNDLKFLICGQEGFASIEADIRKATRSIDLVLWGFDPAMELVRQGSSWPRGTTYGDLLIAKAAEGVKVRMLLWFEGDVPLAEYLFFLGPVGRYLALSGGYVPGVNPIAQGTHNATEVGPLSGVPWKPPTKALGTPAPPSGGYSRNWTLTDRANYCRDWWTKALRGGFKNLEIRLRKIQPGTVASNAKTYLPESVKSFTEKAGMTHVATHHQKPVLIDYGVPGKDDKDGQPLNTCGYVMGLNSVSDYWDTHNHGYNDAKRELSPHSSTVTDQGMWYVKPFRDYAIRVEGEALYNLNENFVQGWDSADGYGAANGAKGAPLAEERKGIQPKDIPRPQGASCRAQIVRTYPAKNEATILKAYTLASSNAVNYIYVENQYFQLSEWPKLLKKIRQQYRQGMSDAGASVKDITPLHVFVVTPQAERDQMVPNTYDTLKQLGQSGGMQSYDNRVQGKPKPPIDPLSAVLNPIDTATELLEDPQKDAIAKASREAAPANPVGELNDLGIKALAAMLMTYDAANQSRDIRIKERDSNALNAKAAQEEKDNAKAKRHQGKANDVDLERLDECKIQPGRYREIYIHSKLMLVDDVYTTLGSANLNARSMVGDSEFNICTENISFTQDARRRVWGNLAGADLDGKTGSRAETGKVFGKWAERMNKNKFARTRGNPPINESFIHPFEDPRDAPLVRVV